MPLCWGWGGRAELQQPPFFLLLLLHCFNFLHTLELYRANKVTEIQMVWSICLHFFVISSSPSLTLYGHCGCCILSSMQRKKENTKLKHKQCCCLSGISAEWFLLGLYSAKNALLNKVNVLKEVKMLNG